MNKPIIALDFQTYEEVESFLAKFSGETLSVKVGMELFYSNGPVIVEKIKQQNHQIFLDLKLHDIPNTVKSAMIGLAKLGVDMVNVHAAGGKNMMEAALEGLEIGSVSGKRPKIIAVTQLTSTSETDMQTDQLIKTSLLESVLHYSDLTKQAGLDGVVCSALEAEAIKQQNGADFLRVTPGIRLASDAADDQIRVVTPEKARLIGSSNIVVGRSITRANDPVAAYNQVLKEWNA
ncbi:orotidine-5'-phosphate decarboxylase [Listeria cossartiae subsp. cayugensis]|uniref:Orotidine 5'-phosphate decarboxylase n=1 Tax=Listeria cossartiae subsp. cayugensis TaxID=2713505 RepID=A0ABU2IPF5_9LIST|nr:orotidine-5'-phosphate decarboxylase [Listeria cossartiae]MDT0003359.1 orotidine-5'-phosphate decarboxylase [Listeria cossartiae subsp. cayugensis]MDT0019753.1 orotidine-5'-phosphate decarboxylase [Listeria cossartiae subsp. cayugensis]MDT0036633.1 orotidine-5'-phosphate decarboxylase [Listeria cossartiae subsp. cayugensis]MDT0041504.1 orotidine-5'-phosphate decarboxylase [Listeria cossartiae subsp. cayugensis]MDT0046855.1 orotidine-5'-phosphate decarboxylase [Listeria cossartiae subsp. cay